MTTEERKTVCARIEAALARNNNEISIRSHNLSLPRDIASKAGVDGGVADRIVKDSPEYGPGTRIVFASGRRDEAGPVPCVAAALDHIEGPFLYRLRRIAEDPAYRIGETYFMPGIETVHDSMQLDSGQEIANVMGEYHGHRFEVSVRVCGSVRVIFRDRTYKCASRMPKELLDCYARNAGQDGIQTVAKSDGGDYETPYYCDMNNWFELVAFVDGREVATNVIDAPDDNSEEGWKAALIADALEAVDYVESDGDEDDRDDAGIFDLPDEDGGVPYRVLIVRGEDLDGTPDTLANVLELMRDNLNADGRTNHHVERFGTAAEKEAFLKGLRYDSVSYDNFLVLTDEDDIGTVVAEYGEESVRKPVD